MNSGPLCPERSALPYCATPRYLPKGRNFSDSVVRHYQSQCPERSALPCCTTPPSPPKLPAATSILRCSPVYSLAPTEPVAALSRARQARARSVVLGSVQGVIYAAGTSRAVFDLERGRDRLHMWKVRRQSTMAIALQVGLRPQCRPLRRRHTWRPVGQFVVRPADRACRSRCSAAVVAARGLAAREAIPLLQTRFTVHFLARVRLRVS